MKGKYGRVGLALSILLTSAVTASAEPKYDDDGNLVEETPTEEYYDQSGFDVTPNAPDKQQVPSGGTQDKEPPKLEEQIDNEELNKAKEDWVEDNKNNGKVIDKVETPQLPPKTNSAVQEEQNEPTRQVLSTAKTYETMPDYSELSHYQQIAAEVRPSLVTFDAYSSDNVGIAIKDFGKKQVLRDHYLNRENLYGTADVVLNKAIEYSVEIVDVDPTASTGDFYVYDSSINNEEYTKDYTSKALQKGKWKRNSNGDYSLTFNPLTNFNGNTTSKFHIETVYPQVNLKPREGSRDFARGNQAMLVDKGFAHYPAAVVPTRAQARVNGTTKDIILGVRVASVDTDPDGSNTVPRKSYQFVSSLDTGIKGNNLEPFVHPSGDIRAVIPLSSSVYPFWSHRFNPEIGNDINKLFSISGDTLTWASNGDLRKLPAGTMTMAVVSETGEYEFISLAVLNYKMNYTSYENIKGSRFTQSADSINLSSIVFGNDDSPHAKKLFANGELALTNADINKLDTLAFAVRSNQYIGDPYSLAISAESILNKSQNHTLEFRDLRIDQAIISKTSPIDLYRWDQSTVAPAKVTETYREYDDRYNDDGDLIQRGWEEYQYRVDKKIDNTDYAEFYKITGNDIVIRRIYNDSVPRKQVSAPGLTALNREPDRVCIPVPPIVNNEPSCSQRFTYYVGEHTQADFDLKDSSISTVISTNEGLDTDEIDWSIKDGKLIISSPRFDGMTGQKLNFAVMYKPKDGNVKVETVTVDIKTKKAAIKPTRWVLSSEVFSTSPRSSSYVDMHVISSEDTLEGRVEKVWVGDSPMMVEDHIAETMLLTEDLYRVESNMIIISKEHLATLEVSDRYSVVVDYGDDDVVELYFEVTDLDPPTTTAVPVEC